MVVLARAIASWMDSPSRRMIDTDIVLWVCGLLDVEGVVLSVAVVVVDKLARSVCRDGLSRELGGVTEHDADSDVLDKVWVASCEDVNLVQVVGGVSASVVEDKGCTSDWLCAEALLDLFVGHCFLYLLMDRLMREMLYARLYLLNESSLDLLRSASNFSWARSIPCLISSCVMPRICLNSIRFLRRGDGSFSCLQVLRPTRSQAIRHGR